MSVPSNLARIKRTILDLDMAIANEQAQIKICEADSIKYGRLSEESAANKQKAAQAIEAKIIYQGHLEALMQARQNLADDVSRALRGLPADWVNVWTKKNLFGMTTKEVANSTDYTRRSINRICQLVDKHLETENDNEEKDNGDQPARGDNPVEADEETDDS